LKAITERHHPHIVELIAAEAGVEPADVLDFEMILFDTEKSCLGGLMEEFIFSPRLDNLNSPFCATAGLIESKDPDGNRDVLCAITEFNNIEVRPKVQKSKTPMA
jgi:aspartyl aminopeptidase